MPGDGRSYEKGLGRLSSRRRYLSAWEMCRSESQRRWIIHPSFHRILDNHNSLHVTVCLNNGQCFTTRNLGANIRDDETPTELSPWLSNGLCGILAYAKVAHSLLTSVNPTSPKDEGGLPSTASKNRRRVLEVMNIK